jgi:hypothetical protein
MLTGLAAELARVRLAHSLWTVRRVPDPDTQGFRYAASRTGFADISDPTPAGLSLALYRAAKHGPYAGGEVTSSEAIALAAVRAHRLLAELHEPLTMTPGDVRRLLARYQRALTELAEACQPYAPMQADADTGPLPGQRHGLDQPPSGIQS